MAPRGWILFLLAILPLSHNVLGQTVVTAHINVSSAKGRRVAAVPDAVLWLEPLDAAAQNTPWPTHAPYRLVQKSRSFSPHVLVVPLGANVAFPNVDAYFHNVFSLFEGSRFDLGLYEAGSTRNVRFARRGVSYIFCNIHPEMGAVVLTLDTSLWAMAGPGDAFIIRNVPRGTYEVNLWIEGQNQDSLAKWRHTIVVKPGSAVDAGSFNSSEAERPASHDNKFGNPYPFDPTPY